ncbi:MAG: hypothetical protein GW827_04535, partial [Flavobacteriales bacterium]|nr:hypothetical protein [Flavobacteriales bacterium]
IDIFGKVNQDPYKLYKQPENVIPNKITSYYKRISKYTNNTNKISKYNTKKIDNIDHNKTYKNDNVNFDSVTSIGSIDCDSIDSSYRKKRKMRKRKKVKKILSQYSQFKGLDNFGNICYSNSLMQCFTNCKDLYNVLELLNNTIETLYQFREVQEHYPVLYNLFNFMKAYKSNIININNLNTNFV